MYNWRKGIATWTDKKGILYISVPFSWLMEEAEKIAEDWRGQSIIGGPGTMKPSECKEFEPLLFHNACATFATRGCPNNCIFCAVPKLEPDFIEIPNFRPAPIICDNNLLAASRNHLRHVVDAEKIFPIVDFNQGLEAKRFTSEIASMLGELRCKVRFSFDNWSQETAVHDAIELCRRETTKDIQCYCLIGFADTPADAKGRLELIRSWGILPNPMRFQTLNAKKKNEYVHPSWTEHELGKMMRYYSRLAFWSNIPYSEYTRIKC
ncbi:hypothetical protein MUP77_09955 [Candidatus Bathyarchaeota archaeon]|nr:hypothetical protein [Candidatus Bathyarchaeota archaeon]